MAPLSKYIPNSAARGSEKSWKLFFISAIGRKGQEQLFLLIIFYNKNTLCYNIGHYEVMPSLGRY